MFDLREFYKKENDQVRESYQQTLQQIKELVTNEDNSFKKEKEKYFAFLQTIAESILRYAELEQRLSEEYFQSQDFDELQEENQQLFSELLPDNYQTSYANPAYCVDLFGKKIGQLLSYFYSRYRNYINYAFTHRIFKMEEWNRLFLKVYDFIKRNNFDQETLQEVITQLEFKDRTRDYYYQLKSQRDPQYRFYQDIILTDDLSDPRYLFKFGSYISESEIKMAKFMRDFPEEKLSMLAKTIVKAYQLGFERDGKDLSKKSAVSLYYHIGMERLYRKVIQEFQGINLNVSVHRATSTPANRQYNFDHQFDEALYASENWLKNLLNAFKKAVEQNKEILKEMSGIVGVINFGEEPFNPENKPEILKLSEEQTKLVQQLNNEAIQYIQKYQNRAETSFSIIAFPSPDIGEQFEEIFDATIEINTIDTEKYERIQQKIIDALDQADKIHVKGKGDNQTDLIIQFQELENPEKETNFVNSGSNVNIPAGEVFTSPKLQGTEGVLHVKESYQRSRLFKNLKVTFKDGYVTDYSCSNYDSEEENKKYIEENLLFPHKTLPMGECAIGTNTLAYVYSRKYDILEVLPILISEKTAPHFAIGDTCFARSEDVVRYNKFTNKRITACDNEKSILRKSDKPQEAYTNVHHDIVFPFDSIDFISGITKEGARIDIIKDGLFVLAGTEELNEPLLKYRKEKK
ncbi:MAG: leucyl aminopeptidase [Candidatus Heimdallarchaeota archaeon]|nr:leucyl aminopeptidase [Candidatus Heimdallarchaeota archaeon]